ncbi:hypothetical protein D3C78_1603340 [compost metagenome]
MALTTHQEIQQIVMMTLHHELDGILLAGNLFPLKPQLFNYFVEKRYVDRSLEIDAGHIKRLEAVRHYFIHHTVLVDCRPIRC